MSARSTHATSWRLSAAVVMAILTAVAATPSVFAQSELLDSGHSGVGAAFSFVSGEGPTAHSIGGSFSLLGWGDIGVSSTSYENGTSQSLIGLTVLAVKQKPRVTRSRVNAPFSFGFRLERASNIYRDKDLTALALVGYRRFDLGEHSFFGTRAALGIAELNGEKSLLSSIGADLAFDMGEHLLWVFNLSVSDSDNTPTVTSGGIALVVKIIPPPKGPGSTDQSAQSGR